MCWRLVAAGGLALLVVLTSCGTKKRQAASDLLAEATEDFEQESFELAIQNFRELLEQYPFSEYGEEAELRIAHASFLAGNFPEAVAAFTDFQRRHPTSPYLPFAGYVLGLCYAEQMGTIDRDQSASLNAHNYFATVAQQYPDSPFAELAREELAECRAILAEHELYIANFYARHQNVEAAEMRLLGLVARYADTEMAADALNRLATLYLDQDSLELADLADAALAQSYPRSRHAAAAHRRLKKRGAVGVLARGDAMPRLLAELPPSEVSSLAEAVQVPGLESSDGSAIGAAGGGPPLLPPAAFEQSGAY